VLVEDPLLLGAKVVADHGHDAHLREIAGRQREVGGRAAKNIVHAARRRRDVIERNRTYYENAHCASALGFVADSGQWIVISGQ